jgi:acyl-CoA dehydrogenase
VSSPAAALTPEDRELLLETAADLFNRATPLLGRLSPGEAELGRRVWRDVEQAELAHIGVDAEKGGAGGDLADACAVLRVAARFAPPIPLAETQLAAWLAAEAGLPIPSGPLTVGPTSFVGLPPLLSDGRLGKTTLDAVPFAGFVDQLVLLTEKDGRPWVVVVDLAQTEVTPAPSLSGEPWGKIRLDGARPAASAQVDLDLDQLLARGALFRAQQIAGALSKALELAVAYAGERVQFGRPISRFQAVQHHLADIAAETVAAGVAAEAGAELAESGKLLEAAAIAKSRAGLAVRVAAVAHQVHGAIGVTEEHPLHLFTRRMWDWRDDFGSDVEWSARLGRQIAQAGGARLWAEVSEIR